MAKKPAWVNWIAKIWLVALFFALRGFGEFEVRWGIGAYGKEITECPRRMSPYEKEEILYPCGRV